MLFVSHNLVAKTFSVMAFNVENMFDNSDDPNKDETYLPVSMKTSKIHINNCNKLRYQSWRDDCLKMDWNDEVIDYKLAATAEVILSYGKHGPDIIGFQEIENINILERLFKLLEPHGYKYYALVEEMISVVLIMPLFLNIKSSAQSCIRLNLLVLQKIK